MIHLMRHATIEAILQAHWSPPGEPIPLEDLREGSFGGDDRNGEPVEDVSFEDMVAGIQAAGMWAFSHRDSGTLHIWLAPEADPGLLMDCLGHECCHLLLPPLGDWIADEQRAESYGAVTSEAYALLRRLEARP